MTRAVRTKCVHELKSPGLVSWNAIINGYRINGHGEFFLSSMRCGIVGKILIVHRNRAFWVLVIMQGWFKDVMVIFSQKMKDNKTRPSQDPYECVVDMLMRSGYLSATGGFNRKLLEEKGPNICTSCLSISYSKLIFNFTRKTQTNPLAWSIHELLRIWDWARRGRGSLPKYDSTWL